MGTQKATREFCNVYEKQGVIACDLEREEAANLDDAAVAFLAKLTDHLKPMQGSKSAAAGRVPLGHPLTF